MNRGTRHVAVIGLGDFGSAVAWELTHLGDHVLGVDIDSAKVTAMGEEIELVAQADAKDIRALKELALPDYDAVVIAIGETMEANLVAVMNARELGCEILWVKAQSQMHERILRQLGVEHIVLPDQQAGKQIAERVHNPMIGDFMNINEKHYVAKVDVGDTIEGMTMEEVGISRHGKLTCLAVERDGELQPLDTVTLKHGDRLVVFGDRESMQRLQQAH